MTSPVITADAVFSAYPAIFDALNILDVVSVNPSSGVKKIIAWAGGSVDPSLIAEVARDSTVDLAALSLGVVLAACSPVNGLKISSAAKIQYQQRDDGGTFTGAGTHITLTTAKGFLWPDSINAKQDDEQGAQISMKFAPLVTGSNPPLIVNVDQSITQTPGVAALYKLGPVGFEGSALGGIQSSSVKFGMDYKPFRAGGATGAAEGFIRKRNPTFEFETTNLAILGQIGMGIIGITTGCTLGFAKIGSALTDAAHVLLTIGTGSYEVTDAGVSGEGDAMAKVTVTATGTIAVNTAAALA